MIILRKHTTMANSVVMVVVTSCNNYSCGLSTATIEYSCPSVCLCVCVCVSVCLSVCLSVYMITQKIMVQST